MIIGEIVFGTKELKSWVELRYENGKQTGVGMGSSITRDKNGDILSIKTEETGLKIMYE